MAQKPYHPVPKSFSFKIDNEKWEEAVKGFACVDTRTLKAKLETALNEYLSWEHFEKTRPKPDETRKAILRILKPLNRAIKEANVIGTDVWLALLGKEDHFIKNSVTKFTYLRLMEQASQLSKMLTQAHDSIQPNKGPRRRDFDDLMKKIESEVGEANRSIKGGSNYHIFAAVITTISPEEANPESIVHNYLLKKELK